MISLVNLEGVDDGVKEPGLSSISYRLKTHLITVSRLVTTVRRLCILHYIEN